MIIDANDLAAATSAQVDTMRARQAQILVTGVPTFEAYREGVGYLRACTELGNWMAGVVKRDGAIEGMK